MKNEKLNATQRNLIRIRKMVDAELLIAQTEFNKNNKLWQKKSFDFSAFIVVFNAGMKYPSRLIEGNTLEKKEEEKK